MKNLLSCIALSCLALTLPAQANNTFEAVGQIRSVNIATGSIEVDQQRYQLPLRVADSQTRKGAAIAQLRLGTTVRIVGAGRTIEEIAILSQPTVEEEQLLLEELANAKPQ